MRSRQGTHPDGQAEQGHLAALESAGHVRYDESTHVYERIRYVTTVGSGPDPVFDAGVALLRMGGLERRRLGRSACRLG
jgi:hypothetical protein